MVPMLLLKATVLLVHSGQEEIAWQELFQDLYILEEEEEVSCIIIDLISSWSAINFNILLSPTMLCCLGGYYGGKLLLFVVT